MSRKKATAILLILVVLNSSIETAGQQGLEAKLAGARLPTTLWDSSAVYDGVDNVYIFGGITGSTYTGEILRYAVSLDRVEKVSSLQVGTYGGLALIAEDGTTIYYFGGNQKFVQKFDSLTNSTVRIPTDLPWDVCYSGGVSMSGTIFLFDGYRGKVMEFSEETERARIIGDLPFQNGTSTVVSTTAIPDGNDGVWVFSGSYVKPSNPILLFNTTTKEVSSSANTSLPTLFFRPASVSDGGYGYLIGGLGWARDIDGSTHPSDGILKVNMDDASIEFLSVVNFPAWEGSYFDYTTAVYVDKLNRIYIFGGYTYNGTQIFHDSIWYIDLPSPPVPAFDCSNLTQGSYPHPTDCSSFFVCVDGELFGEFSCPRPLVFDPIQQACNFLDEVVCFFSCEGKEGFFPHPSDCSKFLGCRGGIPNVEVFNCPEPLLFDPVLLKCNIPQLVECS